MFISNLLDSDWCRIHILWVLDIHWFGGSGCDRNNTFVALSIVCTVIVLAMSTKGSLFCGSITCIYTTYLLTNALFSDPDKKCNTLHGSDHDTWMIVIGMIISLVAICYSAVSLSKYAELAAKQEESEPLLREAVKRRKKKRKQKDSDEESPVNDGEGVVVNEGNKGDNDEESSEESEEDIETKHEKQEVISSNSTLL
eukprot:UN27850